VSARCRRDALGRSEVGGRYGVGVVAASGGDGVRWVSQERSAVQMRVVNMEEVEEAPSNNA
jgi:hypothetical protein